MKENPDQRWPKSLETGRNFPWYVSESDKDTLKEVLKFVPIDQARSFTAAIFFALKRWLQFEKDEELGLYPPSPSLDMEKVVDEIQKYLLAYPIDEDRVPLLKPVLLVYAISALESSYGVYRLLGRHKSSPWPDVKEAIRQMLDSPEWKKARSILSDIDSTLNLAVIGSWRDLLKQILRDLPELPDPVATITKMQEALEWMKEEALKQGGATQQPASDEGEKGKPGKNTTTSETGQEHSGSD